MIIDQILDFRAVPKKSRTKEGLLQAVWRLSAKEAACKLQNGSEDIASEPPVARGDDANGHRFT